MHRFVWDLHYPEPDVLDHDYPISAIYHDTPRNPLGATVLPGKYVLRLETTSPAGGMKIAGSFAQPLIIEMDPRVKTSPNDLQRQFELDRKIADALHRDYDSVQQVRSVRAQLKSLPANVPDAIKKSVTELDGKAASIAGGEGGYGGRYLSTPEGRSLTRLNGGLNAMVSGLDSVDAAPTTQQVAMFGELDRALGEQLTAWAEVKGKELAALNEQLKKAGIAEIDPAKAAPGAGDAMTTQDRDEE
jgi:hypothetical protein